MTLQQRISALITAIGTDVKDIYTKVVPAGGTTGQVLRKTSNTSYATEWATPSSTGATIDDTTAAADKVFSSTKTNALIATAKTEVQTAILGGASSAYDTLVELQAFIEADATATSALTIAVGNRVRFDAAQTLTSGEKIQAKANIDAYGSVELGNPDTDLAALYVTAKA